MALHEMPISIQEPSSAQQLRNLDLKMQTHAVENADHLTREF